MASLELKTVGIVANPHKADGAAVLVRLRDAFEEAGVEVCYDEVTWELLRENAPGNLGRNLGGVGELAAAADIVVVLGGDGTILGVVSSMGAAPKPVAGINTGALGFLTAATAEAAEGFVRAICRGGYKIDRRTMVVASLVDAAGEVVDVLTGLNEVVVSRGSISRIVNLETFVDGQFLNRFHADGLIVATPTGSTAYSLSAGGPLIAPDARVLVITPICPHALANRSLVVADTAQIEIRREDAAEEIVLTADGQRMVQVPPKSSVRVARAAMDVPLVQLQDHGIYDVLQNKLNWRGSNVPREG